MTKSRLEIIYDGACPFCSRYVQLVRIRENFDVELIDARKRPLLGLQYKAKGYDLADGMIARLDGENYFGSEAIAIISLVSSRSGIRNRFLATCFRNRKVSATVYPLLRLGRNLTLVLLGRNREF